MTDACNVLDVELGLDRAEAQLAKELPDHMRSFAAAYLARTPLPPAPDVMGRASTVAIGRRALPHPILADRGLALLRLVVPVVIERDRSVAIARASTPSWSTFATLATARDAAARARFDRGALEVIHQLHGSAGCDARGVPAPCPPIVGWRDSGPALDATAIDAAWRALAVLHGVSGRVRIERAEVRPRAFIVEPGREVIVAVPVATDSAAARFAVLHELGHAVANLVTPHGLPRVLDEACASYIARSMEQPGLLAPAWHSPLAGAARERRTDLARLLDAIERGVHEPAADSADVPWALWHDPGAQAAYVEAEAIADRLWATLGPAPARGGLGAALTAEHARIDRTTTL